MNEVKIQIPDNCELIKDGDIYIVKEKKQEPPKSWEEFCEKFPIKGEAYINLKSQVKEFCCNFPPPRDSKSAASSKKEAEAFLALMQLRQLRKAWIGSWKQPNSNITIAIIAWDINEDKVLVKCGNYWSNVNLSFPSTKMARNFLDCFRDLCETAKLLL